MVEKSLNILKRIIRLMKKRGQVLELFGVLFIIGISIFGAQKVYYQKENIYVGYEQTAYKYTDCKEFIETFPKEEIIILTSLEEAKRNGFEIKDCK